MTAMKTSTIMKPDTKYQLQIDDVEIDMLKDEIKDASLIDPR